MATSTTPRGRWIHRFSIWFFTVILGILLFWGLGFVIQDIAQIPGPDYRQFEMRHVDQALFDQRIKIRGELDQVKREISNKQDELKILSTGSTNLQETMSQLIELQRLRVQKSIAIPDTEQENISTSLNRFLDNQRQFQELNNNISRLTEKKRGLENQLQQVESTINKKQQPARDEYDRANQKHRLKLAAIQLGVLIPVLLICGGLFIKKRASAYFPMILGMSLATLLRVVLVMHRYFPAQYFKYILIVVLIVIVMRILIHFIRVVAFPRAQWLVKQYREAYEHFLCPVCEYPIRTGPRRFLFWKRRTVHKLLPAASDAPDEPYTCPACGASLYEKCDQCQQIRHALLPHCQHCGQEKDLAALTAPN